MWTLPLSYGGRAVPTSEISDQEESMSRNLAERDGLRALKALASVGGSNWEAIGLFLLIATLLGFFNSALFQVVLDPKGAATALWVMMILSLGLLLFTIGFLRHRVSNTVRRELAPSVDVERSRAHRVLVLFLSLPPGSDPEHRQSILKELENSLKASQAEPFTDAWLEVFGRHNWRMPAESIARQLAGEPRLIERIVVIPSLPVPKEANTHEQGSSDYFKIFKEIMGSGDSNPMKNSQTKIHFVGEIISEEKAAEYGLIDAEHGSGRKSPVYRPEAGVSFEDLDAMMRLLFAIYRELSASEYGYREKDILLDATSGKALVSIAAAGFAILTPGRQFQYVDTNNYDARSYDVTVDLDLAR